MQLDRRRRDWALGLLATAVVVGGAIAAAGGWLDSTPSSAILHAVSPPIDASNNRDVYGSPVGGHSVACPGHEECGPDIIPVPSARQ